MPAEALPYEPGQAPARTTKDPKPERPVPVGTSRTVTVTPREK